MAMLTKGMSYRRQGSSGLIWAENMVVTEDGVFAMSRQQNDGAFLRTPVKTAQVPDSSSGAPMMGRSKSVGSSASATTAAPTSRHKPSFRVVKWLKKAFTKIRG